MKGLYHQHLRARGARETEPYPARKVSLWVLDMVVLAAGVIGPVMTAPQILKILVLHNAAGISTLTWGMYALLDIPWIVYGIAHASRPILWTYILWFLVNTFVAVEALMFGAGLF